MKKLISIALLTLTAAFSVSAGDIFFPTKQGKTLTYADLDAKGNVTGFTVNTIRNVTGSSNNITVTIGLQSLDRRSRPQGTASYTVTISGGIIEMDMQKIFDAQRKASGKSEGAMEMSGNTVITIPAKLAPGVKMPDHTMRISGNWGPIKFDGDLVISNRQCVATETITVPAGTFECVKVTNSRVFIMGGKTRNSAVEHTWYAPGIGRVKQVSREDGKVKSTTVLHAVTE